MEPLMELHLKGKILALPAHNRLGRKWLILTTLADNNTQLITAVKGCVEPVSQLKSNHETHPIMEYETIKLFTIVNLPFAPLFTTKYYTRIEFFYNTWEHLREFTVKHLQW